MISPSLTMAKYCHIGDVLLALTGTSYESISSQNTSSTSPPLAVVEMLTDGAGDSMIN
jgi:hypothetical protein